MAHAIKSNPPQSCNATHPRAPATIFLYGTLYFTAFTKNYLTFMYVNERYSVSVHLHQYITYVT